MRVNALMIRQSFGKVLEKLKHVDEPIIIEKGRKPVAVLISMKTFKKRFIDYQQEEAKLRLLEEFEKNASKVKVNSMTILRELRYG